MNVHAHAPVSIAVAQLNLTVGDLVGNADRIIAALDEARAAGAQLMLTPELALSGYPPEDLLLRADFYRACAREVERIAAAAQGVTVVLGHPVEDGGERYNAASVLRDGAVLARYHKSLLPNYEVFDEERYFEAGGTACVFECAGVRFGRPALHLATDGTALLRYSVAAPPANEHLVAILASEWFAALEAAGAVKAAGVRS